MCEECGERTGRLAGSSHQPGDFLFLFFEVGGWRWRTAVEEEPAREGVTFSDCGSGFGEEVCEG